ncbi:MAG: cation:dicarboxylase symporter family transporter [Treponema sp.]|nr:cation:dicarboxylase symporter family transporter [Treponema sp.]
MKVWIKLLIGSILGIALGSFLPENPQLFDALAWLEQLAIRVGRYAIIPALVFSLTIGIYELRQDGQFWPLVLKNFLVIIGVSVFVIFTGVFITLVFPPSRIPILAEERIDIIGLDVAENIMDIFPGNMFAIFAGKGVYLFPVCVFAFFFGMGLSYDKSYSKPVISLVDSLSRIFYHIAWFFIEILGFLMIVLAACWTVQFREILRAEIFFDLILLLGIVSGALAFVILPLFLYFLKPKVNPWQVLYGYLGSAIAAFFSRDINFTLPVLLRNSKDNFGIRRRSASVSLVLFSTFCRAGSAMVAAMAFFVIIKSYSSLGISMAEVFSVSLRALAISFLLARHPGDGAYTALAVLCLGYGGGFEAGYLILKPMAFFLIAVGTFLDIMIASFASYACAQMSGFVEEKNVARFS